MLRETVEIVKSMWTEPDTTYDGQVLPARRRAVRPEAGAAAAPADLDRRRRRAAHVAGRRPPRGPRRTSAASRTSSQHKCEVLQGHCEAVGRDYDEIAKTWSPEVFIRETEQEIIDGGTRVFFGEPFESWREGNLVGTPEQVSEKMQAYVDLGCTGFVPWCSRLPRYRVDAPVRGEGDPELPLKSEVGGVRWPSEH